MARLEKYAPLLNAMHYADPKTRIAIVRSGPNDFIKCLIEVGLNFLKGNIKVNNKTLTKLRDYKTRLRKFSTHRGAQGVQKARRQLVQKGGILPLLIPLLAGLGGAGAAAGIAGAVIPSIAKKAARSATNSAIDTIEERAKKVINNL